MSTMLRQKPNCYKCIYRGRLSYSAHSQCCNPKAETLDVKGNPTGIRKGWFNFPHNFDPVWLESCNGFEEL